MGYRRSSSQACAIQYDVIRVRGIMQRFSARGRELFDDKLRDNVGCERERRAPVHDDSTIVDEDNVDDDHNASSDGRPKL